MRDKILGLLKALNGSLVWVNSITAFIESKETRLLSHEAGTYVAYGLLAEFKIRLKSANDAGIKTVGIVELMNTLRMMNGDEIIRNYAFESDTQAGTVYVDEKCEKLIGAALVDTRPPEMISDCGTPLVRI